MTSGTRKMPATGAISLTKSIEPVVERRIDRVLRVHQEHRVAVGAALRDRLGRDVAAGAGPDLDDELLAEMLARTSITSVLAAAGPALKIQLKSKSARAIGDRRLRRRLSRIFQRLIKVSAIRQTLLFRPAWNPLGKIHEAICQSPRIQRCCRLL